MDNPNKNINKELSELNYIIDQMDLIDIYRIFLPMAAEYSLSAHETLSKIGHMSSCRFKNLEIGADKVALQVILLLGITTLAIQVAVPVLLHLQRTG